MPKTRSEINRANYLKNQSARQEAARLRQQTIRQGWRDCIAEWDRAHEWTEPPADWAATGLSQHAIESAMLNPADGDYDDLFKN